MSKSSEIPRFALASPFLANHFEIEITAERYNLIRSSRDFLKEYMRFEETVLQCLYSFQEFEEFLLQTALQHHLFPHSEYHFFQDTRVRSNIKVLSLLNSVTSLRNQFPKFRSNPELQNIHGNFRTYWETERKGSTSFSFFERLRNYAQHQTQPVSGYTTGSGWDEKRDTSETRAAIYVTVSEICDNRNIRSDERSKYVGAFGEKADLSLVFRETIGKIGRIAKRVRADTDAIFAKSQSEIESALAELPDRDEGTAVCDVVEIVGDQELNKFSVFADFLDRANRLRRNFLMENNELHVVSNRAMGHKMRK